MAKNKDKKGKNSSQQTVQKLNFLAHPEIKVPFHYEYQDKNKVREFQVELRACIDEINSNIKIYNDAINNQNSGISKLSTKIELLIKDTIYNFPPDYSSDLPEVQKLFQKTFQTLLDTINPANTNLTSSAASKKKKLFSVNEMYLKIAQKTEKQLEKDFNLLLQMGADKKQALKLFFGSIPQDTSELSSETKSSKKSLKKSDTLTQKISETKNLVISKKSKSKLSNKNTAKNEIIDFIKTNELNNLDNLQELKKKITSFMADNDISFNRKLTLKTLISLIEKEMGVLLHLEAQKTKPYELEGCDFPKILARMPSEQVAEMARILAYGKNSNITYLKDFLRKIYPNKKSDEFILIDNFLKTHKLSFLGGGNSKNFKVENIYTNKSYVLKLDNRLNAPKQMEAKLMVELKKTMTPIYAERQTTFKNNEGLMVTRVLLFTEYCAGGDLDSHAQKQPNVSAKLKSAVNIYRQMAETLETIRKQDVLFPDLKNTNWLIDEKRQLRIADTKSFLPTKDCFYNKDGPENKWYSLLSTRYMNPPEFQKRQFYADPVHAFQLGKNLYQYLTGCDYIYLFEHGEGALYNFEFAIFKTEEGKELRQIIIDLIKPNPDYRKTVAKALVQLEVLDQNLNPSVVQQPKEIVKEQPQRTPKDKSIPQYQIPIDSQKQMQSLIRELAQIKTILEYKCKKDNKYSEAKKCIVNNSTSIFLSWNALSRNPNPKNLKEFKLNCITSINNMENELSKHRGYWFSEVSHGLRIFIGIIAAITVIPAVGVIVAGLFGAPGFIDTFFSKPKTDSLTKFEELKIADLTEDLMELELDSPNF
ncbi:MAG: protein kinase [Tatlockia sp.]|nr:protein kinase [Tatlockia sp.]